MRADRRYYLNADRSKIVEEGSAEAAYLLAAEGADIPTEDARRYKLGRYADEEAKPPEPVLVYSTAADPEPKDAAAPVEDPEPTESKMQAAPAENKARTMRAGKADESK